MLHPATELRFINSEIGYGVFATEFIPHGTITWVRDSLDQTFSPAEFIAMSAMSEVYHEQLTKYAYRDEVGDYVLCWDLGRFMNHSCNPSCLGYNLDLEMAVRDIAPGEELTSDYSTFHLTNDEGFACSCSSLNCRNFVSHHDVQTQSDRWYYLMRQAFLLADDVAQPLDRLMTPQQRQKAIQKLLLSQPLLISNH
ncbi:SET domain-containing protein [Merismopedia glauca]|uniref:SET domain-containing protein-lysine N-methyltransferase n=1 Tax=Merismopedia glauca CCAP 1448/3 TaxID=1296344 RepID=A0A2T1C6B5_9CYAN|nr:SET domain-containing protein-lysine N-methyltransferase [Merismopedia glauca]PSB03801.1 SET domain-containing protein-lysine N-methyltransferase [Merismopedia glauca CCAP 1448/3]